MEAIAARGQKYLVLGERSGGLKLHAINGTLLGHTHAVEDEGGIQSLGYVSQLIYRSSSGFGLFSPDDQVTHRPCGRTNDMTSVVQVVGAQRIIMHADGELQSVSTKDKSSCRSEWSIASEPMELFALKGFVLGLTPGPKRRLKALEISKGEPEIVQWERALGEVAQADLFRRFGGSGGMFAALHGSRTTVDVWELFMEPSKQSSFFGGSGSGDGSDMLTNMKMPIFGVAILLVVGYQYMKINKGRSAGSASKGAGFADFKRLAEMKKNS